MHDFLQAPASRQGRLPVIARHALLGLAIALALGGCKVKTGSDKGPDGKEKTDKAPEAVPVEVAASVAG